MDVPSETSFHLKGMPVELPDEKFVRELLGDRHGCLLRKVPESNVKTFDYELVVAETCLAAVEIKTFERAPRTEENGWRRDPNSRFLVRDDNAPSRVAAIVHKACKQFGGFAGPRVLVMVNDEHQMDAADFDEAFNGFLDYGDEQIGFVRNVASSKRTAIQRIRDERLTIDLYIWINRYGGCPPRRPTGLTPAEEPGPFFKFASQRGYELARKCFGAPEMTPQ